MGAIGSVCCDDDNKGKKQRLSPAPNIKPAKKKSPEKLSQNPSIPDLYKGITA